MEQAQAQQVEPVAQVVRFNELMDIYGELLTERQRRLARMHFEDDLSFAEIAQEESISRQAAHDAVKHATMALEKFERHLGILKARDAAGGETVARDIATAGIPVRSIPDARERLTALRDRLRRSSGVIYSSDWIVDGIEEALKALGGETPKP